MEKPNDRNGIPEHLIQTVETLLNCLSLSQQNEMSFPPSLYAHERSFVHKRAKELKYYSVTKRGFGLCNRFVCVYKNAPQEVLTLKYPIVLLHDTLSRIFSAMEKNPITSMEMRNFVLIKDHDDMNNQDTDFSFKSNRDYSDLEYNFPLPGQAFKAAKFNSAVMDHRKSLAIYNYKQIILSYLTENRIVLIHGGVASGKSTQVPQYLMEKCIEAKVGYKIILCEPHRITAVAVAERIAFERREEIGQSVGYQIPLETKKSATSIVICVTPDVLLKMLISKEQVFQGKVIVVMDEFEECDYITEFVLIALKDLFKVNQYLRLIIMTNAPDVSALYNYFQYPKAKDDLSIKTACINVTSNIIRIQEFFLEDILMRTDYLARSRLTNVEISPTCGSTYSENLGINNIEKNALEVINSTMEKAWTSGDDDGFIFLINMMKKSVISVNYKCALNGVTLLMSASNYGKINYVSELLKLGADATIRCHSGYTASDLAMNKNQQEIMQMLDYYLICNNEKVFLDREFVKLTACTRSSEHTERLIQYYDNFYPENGIDHELLFTVLLHVHAFSKPGAVMIFLPSFSDILAFRELLFERESQLVCKGGNFILRYLYTNMQTCEQKLIFQSPPPNCRKIILSTDVGAVGITISDLVYIIDTGKIEKKMYVDHTGRLTFVTGWISGSHALQRSTKIGRLQAGFCYRLYPQLMTLPKKTPWANLFSCSPQMLCLYTKQIIPFIDPVISYLQRAFTVPDFQSIKQSVDFLKSIDAFDICKSYEYLTELGKIMLQLPLEPQYAKMVLYAVALKCLDPILTIAAFSKHKSIFTLEQDYKTKSHVAGKEWRKIASKFYSDHLILIKMFLGRQDAGVDKREKKFCEDYCISQATMELVNTTRSNIVGHLRAMGIVKTRGVNDMRDLNSNSKEWVFVKAALVGGLYPNLVSVDRTKNKLFCGKNNNEVLLNPLSVLMDYSLIPSNQLTILSQSDVIQHLPTDWIVCNELSNMYSENIYTASVCTSVTPVTLALFAGSYKICSTLQNQQTALLVQNTTTNFAESDSEDDDNSEAMKNFMIDTNLQFNMDNETAKSILYLRVKWFSYFFKCLKYPSKPTTPEDKCVLDTIANVLKNEEKYKFPAGDPAFIGHKPAAYTIDLFQQPIRSKSVSDMVGSVGNNCRSPTFPGLITENSRFFLIKSYNGNNISASLLRGRWKFEQSTEMKLLEVFRTGAEIKLIFQFTGTNCFQGMALLLSDRYCPEVGYDSRLVGGFLPIQWLKEGLVPMAAVEEYMDPATCNKLKASADGSELDCSLASTLIMMWNTSQMLHRNSNATITM